MSSTGQADVVYRVVEPQRQPPRSVRPGDVSESVRVAHFDGERWAQLGEINRDPGVSMRPPTEANAPKIAIGPTGRRRSSSGRNLKSAAWRASGRGGCSGRASNT